MRSLGPKNLPENGNKNRWNLIMWRVVIVLKTYTKFWGEMKGEEDYFSPKLRVRIENNNNSPHGKFHRFLFPFSSKSYVLYNITWHTQWAWVTCGPSKEKLGQRVWIEFKAFCWSVYLWSTSVYRVFYNAREESLCCWSRHDQGKERNNILGLNWVQYWRLDRTKREQNTTSLRKLYLQS